jgi:hypothetical protein
MNRRQFVIAGSFGLAGTAFGQNNRVPPGLVPPRQRAPLPAFSLPDVDGRIVRSGDLVGNVLLLRFWATW